MKLRSGRCFPQSPPASLLDLPDETLLEIFQHNATSVRTRKTYDAYLKSAMANRRLLLIAREALFKEYEMQIGLVASGRVEDLHGRLGLSSMSKNLQGPLKRHISVAFKDYQGEWFDHYHHCVLGHLRALVHTDGTHEEYAPLISNSLASSIRLRLTRRLKVGVSAVHSGDDIADALAALANVAVAMTSLREVHVTLVEEAERLAVSEVSSMLGRIMQRHNGGREVQIKVTRRCDTLSPQGLSQNRRRNSWWSASIESSTAVYTFSPLSMN